jgi:uncharacterized membrane protein
MPVGPVDLYVIAFPDHGEEGELAPALGELVRNQIIRVIDIVFVRKLADGTVSVVEMNDLDDEQYSAFNQVVDEVSGFLSDADVDELSAGLPNRSSAAIVLVEEVWSSRFKKTIEAANGQVVLTEPVPSETIETLLELDEDDE